MMRRNSIWVSLATIAALIGFTLGFRFWASDDFPTTQDSQNIDFKDAIANEQGEADSLLKEKSNDAFGFQDLFERGSSSRQERRSRSSRDPYDNRSFRRFPSNTDLLTWENDKEFKHDVFTFARIQYSYNRYYGRNRWGRPDWAVDMPDSDNNFSFRLQQLTSMKVHFEREGAVVVRLDEKQIYDYPFCYLIEPGEMNLTRPEIEGMRRYLERGGFIMVDDFWGPQEWRNFEMQIRKVFPELRMQELELDHPIFNLVYKLEQKPQIPSIGHYYQGRVRDRQDAPEAHYWELKNKQGKTMMIVCHNTDLGDGWEREGMDQGYFKAYSEKFAYPLGINILTYAMTQ